MHRRCAVDTRFWLEVVMVGWVANGWALHAVTHRKKPKSEFTEWFDDVVALLVPVPWAPYIFTLALLAALMLSTAVILAACGLLYVVSPRARADWPPWR
jgi:hypothetical protein